MIILTPLWCVFAEPTQDVLGPAPAAGGLAEIKVHRTVYSVSGRRNSCHLMSGSHGVELAKLGKGKLVSCLHASATFLFAGCIGYTVHTERR